MPQEDSFKAVSYVCNAATLEESISRYIQCQELVNGYKFLIWTPGVGSKLAALKQASDEIKVFTAFTSEELSFLDAETISDTLRLKKARIPLDYSVSFDTNALSYIKPFLEGKGTLPSGFGAALEFIAQQDINFDPMLYWRENLFNLERTNDASAKIWERLKAYEVLRSLDRLALSKGSLRSCLSDLELSQSADKALSVLTRWRNDSPYYDELLRAKRAMYCLLMKMCLIQLSGPRIDPVQKFLSFLEFCDKELGAIFIKEAALARAYFSAGQGMRFFSKIMRGKSNLTVLIAAMAHDLQHLRWLEEALTYDFKHGARFFIPALLTFDVGLIEVAKLCPLKACAFSSDNQPITFYGNELEKLAGGSSDIASCLESLYLPQEMLKREEVRASLDLGALELHLEQELIDVSR